MLKKLPLSKNLNPHVSVDCVIFGYDERSLKVLLIERNGNEKKHKGKSSSNKALPGNLILDNEDLDTSAKRVLKELTGLENIFLEQFYAFGNPDRVRKEQDMEWLKSIRAEPKARVITVAYYALVKINDYETMPSGFAFKAEWVNVREVPKLSFDHNEVLEKALSVLQSRIRNFPVGYELLPKKFTLRDLQHLYESILGKKLDKRNFRRKILALQLVTPLKQVQSNVSHKPALLYKFNLKEYNRLLKEEILF